VTTTVPIDPATPLVGPEAVTRRTGAAVVVVVTELVAGVALSAVSDRVADVVCDPGVDENVTDALINPRAVPDAIGVTVVDVQVSTVLAAESTHDHPAGVGAETNAPPAGAVIVTTGSLCAGPPAPVIDGVTATVVVAPATAVVGPATVTVRAGGPAVVVVLAELVAGVARSAVSDRVAEVVCAPGVEENVTLALIAPSAVPAATGVAVVEVQVRKVLAPESTQVHPTGVGVEGNVPPLGAVTVTTGSP